MKAVNKPTFREVQVTGLYLVTFLVWLMVLAQFVFLSRIFCESFEIRPFLFWLPQWASVFVTYCVAGYWALIPLCSIALINASERIEWLNDRDRKYFDSMGKIAWLPMIFWVALICLLALF